MDMTKQEYMIYGISEKEIQDQYVNSFTSQAAGIEMTVMSILSDAQHVMEHGDNERARKFMNIAKYILANMLEEKLKVG